MIDPSKNLQEKFENEKFGWKISTYLIGLSLLLMVPLGYSFYQGVDAEYISYWRSVLAFVGVLLLIFSIKSWGASFKAFRSYGRALKEKAAAIREMEVTDKYYFVQSVPDSSAITQTYYVVTKEGFWKLTGEAASLYSEVFVGTKIRASSVMLPDYREIMEAEVVEPSQVAPLSGPGVIMEKAVSEVNINSYSQGTFQYDKLFLSTPKHHYLLCEGKVVAVSPQKFLDTPINTLLPGSLG
jgi:hypothetical protein